MITPDLKPDDPISGLTVADLESLINRIVQEKLQTTSAIKGLESVVIRNDQPPPFTMKSLESVVIVNDEFVQEKSQLEISAGEAQIQKIKEQLARPYDKTAPSFADIALEIASQVSDEEWAKVPTDASIRYRDYLYRIASEDE